MLPRSHTFSDENSTLAFALSPPEKPRTNNRGQGGLLKKNTHTPEILLKMNLSESRVDLKAPQLFLLFPEVLLRVTDRTPSLSQSTPELKVPNIYYPDTTVTLSRTRHLKRIPHDSSLDSSGHTVLLLFSKNKFSNKSFPNQRKKFKIIKIPI